MQRGYSKLLLYEAVIMPGDSRSHATSSDLTMLMAFSSAERTETMWRAIVEPAGLAITKIWTSPAALEAIIELERI